MKKKTLIQLLVSALTLLILVGCGSTSEDPTVSGAVMDYLPADTSIISADDLRKAITADEDGELIVIGVIDPTRALIPLSTASNAIEGAYLVWRPDYSGGGSSEAISPEVTGIRRSVEEMEELLSRAGATADSKIVVYAADAMHDAARFVWQLKLLGHENVWYLDGGMNAWLEGNHPTGSATRLKDQEIVSEYKAANPAPEEFNADIDMVIEALQNPDEWVVIDTRSAEEHAGEETGSSSGAFGTGRMAGAVHIEWSQAIDPDTQEIKSVEELEEIYGDVIRGKNVIVFCQSGVRSGHTWLVLTEVLGATGVYNYDGSWIEWSYAASSFSDFDGTQVLELTEEWTDNEGAI